MPLLRRLIALTGLIPLAAQAGPPPATPLWPAAAPGETASLPAEGFTNKPGDKGIAGKPVAILANVSTPTLSVYRPPAALDTGAAVVVFPGGGYYILAWDLEGTEVCERLNAMGVTAVLVKYRVPRRAGLPIYAAPLQDAERAVGLVRSRASSLGIDPARIGVLGFSAGGNLAAVLSNLSGPRTYPRVDAADDASCRPDFCVLVYPAYLTEGGKGETLAPEVAVSRSTPPTFIAMAEDDSEHIRNAIVYYSALQRAGVPAELHLYPKGGHGFGLRRTELPVTAWPDRLGEWLQAGGWLKPAR